jgi:hypothetical protein
MENKNKCRIRTKFSIVIGFILAVLLLSVPCSAQTCYDDGYVDVGEVADINCAIEDNFLMVLGTANLYPGAYVDWGIYAFNRCTINIYGGSIGNGFYIMLFSGQPSPIVTVYGKDFALDGISIDPSATQFSVDPYAGGILTGTYENGDPIYLWFLSDVPIYLQTVTAAPEVVTMTIDIKPGDEQNNINLKSKGVIPVAILTTANFDATTVDPATALLAGASPARWTFADVDGDGDTDILFHFNTEDLNLDENSTEATMTAQLKSQATGLSAQATGGTTVSGTDKVQIISAKKSKK